MGTPPVASVSLSRLDIVGVVLGARPDSGMHFGELPALSLFCRSLFGIRSHSQTRAKLYIQLFLLSSK